MNDRWVIFYSFYWKLYFKTMIKWWNDWLTWQWSIWHTSVISSKITPCVSFNEIRQENTLIFEKAHELLFIGIADKHGGGADGEIWFSIKYLCVIWGSFPIREKNNSEEKWVRIFPLKGSVTKANTIISIPIIQLWFEFT